jgi:hypothetical protein
MEHLYAIKCPLIRAAYHLVEVIRTRSKPLVLASLQEQEMRQVIKPSYPIRVLRMAGTGIGCHAARVQGEFIKAFLLTSIEFKLDQGNQRWSS